jgi:hypothetical protein
VSPVQARSRDLEWRKVDDEVVILDLRTQRYLSLNHSGARLWPLLVSGTSRHQLVEELVSGYGIGATEAGDDVDVLLQQLAEADLLTPPPDARPAHSS